MPNTPSMKDCIEACWAARHSAQETLFHHCIEKRGKHLEESHVRLMADCIEICQSAADFMTRGSRFHASVCATCAEVCEACAQSCDSIGGDEMKHCAEACRKCVRTCREMEQQTRKAA